MTELGNLMSELAAESKVSVVGLDSLPTRVINADIDKLLGFETYVFGDDSIRKEDQHYVRSPNYCGNHALTLSELEKLKVSPLTLSDTSPKHSISFTHEAKEYFVAQQATKNLALAIALRAVLMLNAKTT